MEDDVSTQFFKKDFDLNTIIDKNFLESFKKEFESDNVSIVSLTVLVENEKNKNLISFNNRDKEDKIKEDENISLYPLSKYSFKYNDAINMVFNYLKELSSKLNLGEVIYTNNDNYFAPIFNIKVPLTFDSEQLNKLWDEIFDKVITFMEVNKIDFLLEDMFIILNR